MSDKKMYALKNDEGKYWDFYYARFWRRTIPGFYATAIKEQVEIVADEEGGHVVSLTEEPEKVVLTKEQAEIVEEAYDSNYPASYIAGSSDDEKLIINAYVNGYTVEKPKRYVLPMPGTEYHNNPMHGNVQYYAVKGTENWRPDTIALDTDDAVKRGYTVTQSDIDTAPAWVKSIAPIEVTDDEQ